MSNVDVELDSLVDLYKDQLRLADEYGLSGRDLRATLERMARYDIANMVFGSDGPGGPAGLLQPIRKQVQWAYNWPRLSMFICMVTLGLIAFVAACVARFVSLLSVEGFFTLLMLFVPLLFASSFAWCNIKSTRRINSVDAFCLVMGVTPAITGVVVALGQMSN